LIKTTFGKKRYLRFYHQKNATPKAKKRFFAQDDVIKKVGDPTLGA
jgi:hypothetical protein